MQLENTIPQPLFKTSSPTFVGMSLSGLTPSRLVATDAASELVSVSNLASWIAGTSNRVTVTDDADGTKLSPPAGLTWDILKGQTFLGEEMKFEPTFLAEDIPKRVVPRRCNGSRYESVVCREPLANGR